jgi:hypothetical protein
MLFVDIFSCFNEFGKSPHDKMAFSVLRIGNAVLQHWLRAMYFATVELSTISVCSLLDQWISTPAKTIINHVRDRE